MVPMRPGPRRAALVAAAAVAALLAPGVAEAAPWCGTAAAAERPAIATGHPVRVVYLVPSDGVDRTAEVAPRIWAEIEEIDAWWRTQDPTRAVNFDLTTFACGNQVDLVSRRAALPAAELAPLGTRFDRILDDVYRRAGFDALVSKYLVYYDGPVDSPETCGAGAGITGGTGLAIVFLQACPGMSTAVVGAHELMHGFGALRTVPAPGACAGDSGHVCDAPNDALFPNVQPLPLSSYVLDFGRNDYYGHSSPWFDVQDSLWLRHLDANVAFTVAVRGRGAVISDVPGLLCSSSCVAPWNHNSALRLVAEPARGQRFIRWSGGCEGEIPRCDVLLDAPMSVTAVFAPARYQLAVRVTGQGRVTGAGLNCRTTRCARALTSHRRVTLRATPAKGWRLKGWTGACRGARATCSVPMSKATSVRATFVRRS
jgi:Divergent InlB B-repeat domain